MSLGELSSEELHRVLQSHPDALEEESILQPGLVLDVVSGGEHVLQRRSVDNFYIII